MSRCVTLINSERSKVRTCPQQPWERQKETEHPILTSGQDPKKNRPFVLDHGVVVHHAPCIVARQLSPFLTVKVTLDSCGHFSRHCVFPRNTYQFLHLRDLCKWPWPLTVVRMLCISATLKHTTVQGQLFTFWIGTVTENWQLVMVSHKDAKLFLSFVKPACIKTTITKT